MTLFGAVFGVLLAVVGAILFVKGRRGVGIPLVLIGIALIALGVVAILNFHP